MPSQSSPSQSSVRAATPSHSARRRILERTLIDCLDKHEQITRVGYNLRSLQNAASAVRERLSTKQ